MPGASAPRRWPRTPASRIWSSSCSSKAPTRTRRRPASPRCTRPIMRRDEKMVRALLAHGADREHAASRPGRRRAARRDDFHFAPELVGATPFWLAARFSEPGVMRLLREARRRSAVRAPRRARRRGTRRGVRAPDRRDDGADGGGWNGRRQGLGSASPAEREALTLEAVKLGVELGVDVNAANADGRTALDAARTLKYDTVVAFLVEKGARAGSGAAAAPARGKDSGRAGEPPR